MPDTFDLDVSFADLEHDVARLTRGPGAGQAVRTAERRRRTRRGSLVAAVALCVVGAGAVVLHGRGAPSTPEPASRPLPSAAPMSVPGLDAATRGWTGTWQPYGASNRADLRDQVDIGCDFLVQDQTVAQPARIGSGLFLTTDASQAVEYRMGIRGTDAATQEYHATLAAFDACSGHADRTFAYQGKTEVTVAALPGAGAQGAHVVVVTTHYGDRAGILLLGRVSVPNAARAASLADLALAATIADGTYTEVGPGALPSGTTRIDPARTAGHVWAQALEPTLTGWSTSWNPRLPRDASQAVPQLSLPACAGKPEGSDQGNGLTVNVGRDGFEWVHWFGSGGPATQAVTGLRQALAGCSTPYDVHTVTLPSGRPVVVASGPQVVLWFTRVASHVLVLQLPAGDGPPPDAVSVKVGALIEHVLEQPATTTMSPGTKVPGWMQKEISAAPTFGP